jgi:hypothetical protein
MKEDGRTMYSLDTFFCVLRYFDCFKGGRQRFFKISHINNTVHVT